VSVDEGGAAGPRIEAVVDPEQLAAGRHLFDEDLDDAAVQRFLSAPDHHLLYAYDVGGRVVGFVSGVETTHPDKGTEMFLYELAVDDGARRRGIGRALVQALADLARARGHYGMWVGVDPDNDAALATYAGAGAGDGEPFTMLTWSFDQAAPAGGVGRTAH
jgi:ribosomal protein S18 acetylase RimI-like enzyme